MKVLNRAHSLTAEVEIPKGGAEGVLVCHGGNAGGYTPVRQGQEAALRPQLRRRAGIPRRVDEAVPEGKCELRFEFEPTGKPDVAKGKGAPGRAQLYINGKLVGQGDMPVTVPLLLGLGGGLAVGAQPRLGRLRALRAAVRVHRPIFKVTADVSGKMIQDTEEEAKAHAKAAMARQ